MPFPLPLLLVVTPSRRLRIGLAGLHGAGLAAVLLAALAPAVQAGLGLAVLASLAWHLRPGTATRLRCQADGGLAVELGTTWVTASRVRHHVLTPDLILLHVRLGRAARRLLILPDGLPADDLRRLRVWLRWCAAAGETGEDRRRR